MRGKDVARKMLAKGSSVSKLHTRQEMAAVANPKFYKKEKDSTDDLVPHTDLASQPEILDMLSCFCDENNEFIDVDDWDPKCYIDSN